MSDRAELLAAAAGRTGKSGRWRIGARGREWANRFLAGAAIPVLLFVLWQLAGDLKLISTVFLPTPYMIAAELGGLLQTGELASHLGISVGRAAAGFAIGGSLGLLLGIAAGLSRSTEQLIDPSVQMLRMVPHLAIAPLIILWFGFGETSKIAIIANGAFFPLYVNTVLGIRSVDNKLFEVASVLSFSRFKQIVRLILPAALPNILLGLRISLAVSWLGLVVAELIGSQSGIGFLINIGKQNGVTELIFVGIIIFAVVGKLIDSVVRLFERRWLQWRDTYEG